MVPNSEKTGIFSQMLTDTASVSMICLPLGVRRVEVRGELERKAEILTLATPDYSKRYWKPLPEIF